MTTDRREIREDGKRLLETARARGRVAFATTWLALLWDLVFVGARHDLAQALRAVVRSPAVTIGIALLLGLGVAATTTLFAFVDAVLLRPLPYDQPDRLVMMFESNVSQDRLREGPSPGNVVDWVARNDAFDAITAMMTVSATLRGGDGGTPIERSACHARLLRRVSSSTTAGSHVRCERIRRRGVDHVTAGVQRRAGHRAESSPLADAGRRSSARWPDHVHVEGRDWRVIGVMPEDFVGARRGGRLLGAVGHECVVSRRAFSERTASRRAILARRRSDETRDVASKAPPRGMQTLASQHGVRASGHECWLECQAVAARG